MTAKKKEASFEKALERLEKIVEEMEEGNLPLDDMIARFEEGQELMKVCRIKLNEVQKKVELLVKKSGDEVVTEEFEPASEEKEEDGELF